MSAFVKSIHEKVQAAVSGAVNTDLSGPAWEQALLTLSVDGLGVRWVEELALPCFILASVLLSPLLKRFSHGLSMPRQRPHVFDLRHQALLRLVPSGPDVVLNSLPPANQRAWNSAAVKVSRACLHETANQRDRAHLLDASNPIQAHGSRPS